jgi:hypothetical protein
MKSPEVGTRVLIDCLCSDGVGLGLGPCRPKYEARELLILASLFISVSYFISDFPLFGELCIDRIPFFSLSCKFVFII